MQRHGLEATQSQTGQVERWKMCSFLCFYLITRVCLRLIAILKCFSYFLTRRCWHGDWNSHRNGGAVRAFSHSLLFLESKVPSEREPALCQLQPHTQSCALQSASSAGRYFWAGAAPLLGADPGQNFSKVSKWPAYSSHLTEVFFTHILSTL